ncbi:MAG: sulfatase-like hydrolase/transferase [Leptospiraceae bacterium]|nr:sulfatase-like hydrolase/transferase [Leptospiraceae bacterium]
MARILLYHLTTGTLIFLTFRVLFLIHYKDFIAKESLLDIAKVMIAGFRFDWSVLVLFLAPSLFMGMISPFNKNRFYVIFWKYLPLPFFILIITHLVIDFIYFQNANKHLGYEGFVFLGKDAQAPILGALENQLKEIIIGFIVCVLFLFINILLLKKIGLDVEKGALFRRNLTKLTWAFVFVILGRGGFQNSFIGPSNAIVTNSPMLNQFVLNGVFTTLLDFRVEKFSKLRIRRMNETLALQLVKDVIAYDTSKFIENSPFPIQRKTIPIKGLGKPNIVLILLESWPAKYVHEDDRIMDGKEITPEFQKLMKEGVYFPKFFANGGRTSNGLVSVLTGIPDRPGISLTHTKYSLNRFSGLANLLKAVGYDAKLYYGGETSFENLTPVLQNWGFTEIFDANFFQDSGKYKKGVWGFNDLDVFNQILEDKKLNPPTKPELTVCLTLSTHHPFQIPNKSFELRTPVNEEDQFINSLFYSDYALGKFMEEYKKLPSFRDTIFIFVSDHTSHRTLNYFQDRNIPFLVYSPSRYKPAKNNRISSQIDILPTILGMIENEFEFSAMGRDIFHDSKDGYAYFVFGNLFGFAEKDRMILDTVDGSNALEFTIDPPYRELGPCSKNIQNCSGLQEKAKAFISIQEFLLKKNLISP